MSLPLPLVSLVSPNWGTPQDGLWSTCSNRLRTLSSPVNSKSAWKKDFANGRKHHEHEKETLLNYQQNEERKQYMTMRTSNSSLPLWGQTLCSLLSTNRTAKSNQLVTYLVDERTSRIGEKLVWNKKQRNWGTPMERHYKNSHFNWYIPSSEARCNKVRLWLRIEKSIGPDAPCAKSTKRRVILGLLNLLCLFVPASVEMFPLQN